MLDLYNIRKRRSRQLLTSRLSVTQDELGGCAAAPAAGCRSWLANAMSKASAKEGAAVKTATTRMTGKGDAGHGVTGRVGMGQGAARVACVGTIWMYGPQRIGIALARKSLVQRHSLAGRDSAIERAVIVACGARDLRTRGLRRCGKADPTEQNRPHEHPGTDHGNLNGMCFLDRRPARPAGRGWEEIPGRSLTHPEPGSADVRAWPRSGRAAGHRPAVLLPRSGAPLFGI